MPRQALHAIRNRSILRSVWSENFPAALVGMKSVSIGWGATMHVSHVVISATTERVHMYKFFLEFVDVYTQCIEFLTAEEIN